MLVSEALYKIEQIEREREEWISYCIHCDKVLSDGETEIVHCGGDHVVSEVCTYCNNRAKSLRHLISQDYFLEPESILEEVM